jgi:diguanylate cyclase (GGDEF)-like protein
MIFTDPLTRLLNRSGWHEQASHAVSQAQRHGLPLSVLMIDLDFFKNINDAHGHEAGDAALQCFSQVLKRCQRSGDVAARLGGEEFGVLLPLSDATAAQHFDQRLRTVLAATAHEQLNCPLNFSAGLAVLDSPDETLESLMARADTALYRAKHAGRGRLMLAETPASPPAARLDGVSTAALAAASDPA